MDGESWLYTYLVIHNNSQYSFIASTFLLVGSWWTPLASAPLRPAISRAARCPAARWPPGLATSTTSTTATLTRSTLASCRWCWIALAASIRSSLSFSRSWTLKPNSWAWVLCRPLASTSQLLFSSFPMDGRLTEHALCTNGSLWYQHRAAVHRLGYIM